MCTPNTTISKLQTPTPQSGIIGETEKPNSKTLDNRRKKPKPKQILAAPEPQQLQTTKQTTPPTTTNHKPEQQHQCQQQPERLKGHRKRRLSFTHRVLPSPNSLINVVLIHMKKLQDPPVVGESGCVKSLTRGGGGGGGGSAFQEKKTTVSHFVFVLVCLLLPSSRFFFSFSFQFCCATSSMILAKNRDDNTSTKEHVKIQKIRQTMRKSEEDLKKN